MELHRHTGGGWKCPLSNIPGFCPGLLTHQTDSQKIGGCGDSPTPIFRRSLWEFLKATAARPHFISYDLEDLGQGESMVWFRGWPCSQIYWVQISALLISSTVLAYLGCYKKVPQTKWLKNRNLFPHLLEARSQRSRF